MKIVDHELFLAIMAIRRLSDCIILLESSKEQKIVKDETRLEMIKSMPHYQSVLRKLEEIINVSLEGLNNFFSAYINDIP